MSQVEGRLRAGLDALDAFRATFPAGTMTGAPKVRAMEIIDELEPERRGAYAGAVGYIGAGGDAHGSRDHDPHLRASRTASRRCRPARASCRTPCRRAEWAETENKARAMLTAIGRVREALRARPATAPDARHPLGPRRHIRRRCHFA